MEQTGCGRTIADLADCASLAKAKAQSEAALPDGQVWPWLNLQIKEATAGWVLLTPEQSCLALIRLESLAEWMALPNYPETLEKQRILDPVECSRLRSFSHRKRRLEWLGGRLAAKYALQQFFASCAQDSLPAAFAIDNDRHGRPFVGVNALCFGPQQPFLSISHSGHFAAALVAPRSCGLDLQEIVPKLQRLQARFASPAELALGSLYDETWLALLWSAKEAVKKCRYADQATFMERIQVEAHEGSATEPQGAVLYCRLQDGADGADTLPVRVAVREGYVMAISLGEKHA